MNSNSSFDSDAAWDFLSELMEMFCEQWENAPPIPEIEEFAKKLEPLECPSFHRIGLIELIKIELEFRSNDAFPWQPLDWYLQRFPALGKQPPIELVAEEKRFAPESTEPVHIRELLQDVDPGLTCTLALHRSRNVHQFQPGDSIDDFDLLSRLGRGAFASVYLARQVSMQRLVALKISADVGLEGPTLARLNHPHVVRVFDQRTVPEKALRLMYMEYVAGGSLGDVLSHARAAGETPDSELFLESLEGKLADAGNTRPPESTNLESIENSDWPEVVARIGAQLASAISYTHGEGILHRDIKPANVLLDANGFPKLVDFNISYGNQIAGATAAKSFGGSLGYMSPEQMEAFLPQHQRTASEIDGSCDVYSLGITLYELLTGTRPFAKSEGPIPEHVVEQVLEARKTGLTDQQVETLHAKAPLLGLSIERSLKPRPKDRPAPEVLQRQLNWAGDKQTHEYLNSTSSGWRSLACRFPWLFIFAVAFGVSLFATLYVIEYNQTEAIPDGNQQLFLETRRMVNRIVYPTGLVLLIVLFWRTWRAIRIDGSAVKEKHLSVATYSNLNFGHTTALLFLGIWSFCGFLFPIVLKLRGGDISTKAWVDFSLSHFVAGLICGAFVFFGLTLFSLSAWHPRLALNGIKQGTFVDVKKAIANVRSRVYWYRIIAIGAPLTAIAMLVNFRTSNTIAVSGLSIAALIGLAALAGAIQSIIKSLDLMERV